VKVKVRAFGRLTESLGNETVVELKPDSKIGDLLSLLREKTKAVQKEALIRFDRTEPNQNLQYFLMVKTFKP
jgi:molybdopterin converting factor small subunit